MKPIRLLLCFLALFASIIVRAQLIVQTFEVDGIYYHLYWHTTEEVAAEVMGYKYTGSSDLVIPLKIYLDDKYYQVKRIGDFAFKDRGLKSITIPNSVTSIGTSAFENCGLHSLTIPNSVTNIGDKAFAGCSGLTSITIPDNVEFIGKHAFDGCSSATEIKIGSGVKSIADYTFRNCSSATKIYMMGDIVTPSNASSIGKYAFYGCSSAKIIRIAKSVTSIGDYAFYGCSNLKSAYLPSGVNSIGDFAYYGCYNLYSVTAENPIPVPISNTVFPSEIPILYVPKGSKAAYRAAEGWKNFLNIIDGSSGSSDSPTISFADATVKALCVENWDFDDDGKLSEAEAAAVTNLGTVFQENTAITSFNELQYFTGLTSIGDYAFYGCEGLTSITIPNSVTSIGSQAFYGCSNLTSVVSKIQKPFAFGDSAFANISTNCVLTVPKGTRNAYIAAGWTTSVFKGGIMDSSNITFSDDNVRALCIANWDTDGDGELSDAEAAAVTDLGNVFKGNTTITSFNELQYFTGVTSIGGYAFSHCSGLTSVTIPNSVTTIKYNAFSSCSSLTSLTIPNSVTSIGDCAFYSCKGLTSVTISNSVTKIGGSAFYGCSSLTSVTIPNSVTTILNSTFYGCSSLTSVTIPNSVTTIGSSVFYDCFRLTSVTIPNSVTSIGTEAFRGCYSLASVTIPNSVTTIESFTFYNCSRLASVTIPNSVTTIEPYTFYNCSSLASVTIPNSVTTIDDYAFYGCEGLTSVHITDLAAWCKINFTDGYSNPLFYAKHLFMDGKEITDLVIPNSVTTIGSQAFRNCTSLTSVTIPNSVTTIGSQAFGNCTSLTSVTVKNPIPISISKDVFSNRANATLYVPLGCKKVYELADYWEEFEKIIEEDTSPTINFADVNIKKICVSNWDTTGDGQLSEYEAAAVTDLGNVFKGNTTITSFNELQYFTGVTSISSAFYKCTGLTSVTIPNRVKTIGDRAFSDCSSLTSVTIPNSVTWIGESAFENCSRLTSVTIPNSVTWIGESAFENCSRLTSMTIPNRVTSIGKSVFSGCSGLTSVTIPNSVTTIWYRAFSGCSSLTSVTIPNSVTTIWSGAFENCSRLTSVTIPNSVTTIASSMFSGCNLTSVTIPNSVKTIGSSAFYQCPLTSVTIPNSVTTIGESAFEYCYNLRSVTIGKSVTNIGSRAFFYCFFITVTVENPYPVFITENVFYNRKNATLYVPVGCNAAYKAADYWKEFKEIVEMEAPSPAIAFADDNAKSLCVANWDTNGDGELSEAEAAAVTDLGEVFKGNTTITSFDELRYFTGLTEIGNGAFNTCKNLTSVVIPENVTCIGGSAFSSCFRLSSVTIPEGVKTIKGAAFIDCLGLTAIYIPASVTDIEELAFNIQTLDYTASGHPSVRASITVAEGNTKYDSRGNCNAIIETATNTLLYGCSNTIIPSSVTAISGQAFCNSTITAITIPHSVTSIGRGAFACCSNLTSVVSKIQEPFVFGSGAFSAISSNCVLTVPAGTRDAYIAAGWTTNVFKGGIVEDGSSEPEIILGDLTGDGRVSITDIVMIIDVIAGIITDSNQKAAADVNGDGKVTITDCTSAIDLIAAQGSKLNSARKRVHGMLSNTDFISCTKEDDQLIISLNNERCYTSFQMIVSVPEGMTLGRAIMDEMRGADHQVTVHNLGNGQYLVAGFSINNEELIGNSGHLFSIITNGQLIDNIVISDIEFATTKAEAYYLANEIVSSNTTSIESIQNSKLKTQNDASVYDLSGRKWSLPLKGLYIVNGKIILK